MVGLSERYHPLYEALVKAGIKVPDEVRDIQITANLDDVLTITYTCNLLSDQLAALGRALVELNQESSNG